MYRLNHHLIPSFSFITWNTRFFADFWEWLFSSLWHKFVTGLFLQLLLLAENLLYQLTICEHFPFAWGFLKTLPTSKILLQFCCFPALCKPPLWGPRHSQSNEFLFQSHLALKLQDNNTTSYYSLATTKQLSRSMGSWNKLGLRLRWEYFSWKYALKKWIGCNQVRVISVC